MAAWPDEIELQITGIAQGGDGVGRWEGRAVFAAGALPGERVRVRLHDRQRAFARGTVAAVLVAAPERIASSCPLEDRCGAADWRWITYDAQLRFKAAILVDQLRHIGGLEIAVAAAHGMAMDAPSGGSTCAAGRGWGYRATVELHGGEGKLGYFAPGSRRVIDIAQCCLHHPLIDEALATLRPLLQAEGMPRTVTLRCAPGDETVLAIVEGDGGCDTLARRWMEACPRLVGIVQRTRAGLRLVRGRDHLIQQIGDTRWRVSAGSFFQVNHRQTAMLIDRVVDLLRVTPGERLLDLFCGVGTFALPLARLGAQVTGVEAYTPAVEDARESARLNGVERVTWHVGPVERILAKLSAHFDGAVLDPPRRGCEPAALEQLARLRPARIVYVACHPGTLARDCKLLSAAGYVIERAEVVDLFPHTHHVESIVLLRHSAS